MSAEIVEEKYKTGIIIFTMIILTVILAVVIAVVYNEYNNAEVQHLRDEISEKENVSEDYITGWNDCIQELIDFRNTATNVTSLI